MMLIGSIVYLINVMNEKSHHHDKGHKAKPRILKVALIIHLVTHFIKLLSFQESFISNK
jgi:hypothetical protein